MKDLLNANWAGILLVAVTVLALFAIVLAIIPIPANWSDQISTGVAIAAPNGLGGGAHPTSLLASWWASLVDALNLNPMNWFRIW